jgi:hypothetical protein
LDKGNTDSGNLRIAIFEAEYDYGKTLRGERAWQRKLCHMLALVDAMTRDSYWMYDNEDEEADGFGWYLLQEKFAGS